MNLARITVAEIGVKLEALDRELDEWLQRGEAGEILSRHHSQLRSVTHVLGSAARAIGERLQAVDVSVAANWGEIVSLRVAANTLADVWQAFLDAFVMRSVASFALQLQVADELAWACYEPVHRLLETGSLKEPPLVTAINQRDSSFASDSLRAETLQRLPVPLVSLPWSDIKHLPSLPLLARDVGHIVALDLDLYPTLAQQLESALAGAETPSSRLGTWRSRHADVFAAVYGVLALGPSFARAAVTALAPASGPMVPTSAPSDHQLGPSIRVQIILEALRASGFDNEATSLGADWFAAFPITADQFAPDVPVVVDAIVASPLPQFGWRPLSDVIAFSLSDHENAESSAAEALHGLRPQATDTRVLVGAARLAFDAEPTRYQGQAVGERIQRQIVEVAVAGTRSGGGVRTGGIEVAALRGPDAGRTLDNDRDRAVSPAEPSVPPPEPGSRTRARRRVEASPAPTSPPALSEGQEETRNKAFSAALVAIIKTRR